MIRTRRLYWKTRIRWWHLKDVILPHVAKVLSRLHILRKPFWRLPDAPACGGCGASGEPFYLFTGDSWAWGWCCSDCGPDWFDEETDIKWPFLVNWATGKNWDRLGFYEA